MISYKSQVHNGQRGLNDYGNISFTSIASNNLSKDDKVKQIECMFLAYKEMGGLTDSEMRKVLKKHFCLEMPNSTISARRNDINKDHIKACEKKGLYSKQIIINVNKETRYNAATKRHVKVWRYIR